MANISLALYTNVFFGSALKLPIQKGTLSIDNSVRNISRLGTFKLNQSPLDFGFLTKAVKLSLKRSLLSRDLVALNSHGNCSFLAIIYFFYTHTFQLPAELYVDLYKTTVGSIGLLQVKTLVYTLQYMSASGGYYLSAPDKVRAL
jgi:hypothetical protein